MHLKAYFQGVLAKFRSAVRRNSFCARAESHSASLPIPALLLLCDNQPRRFDDQIRTSKLDAPEKDKEDDASVSSHSSGSTTPNSSSTYQFENHKPFATYQRKIIGLLGALGCEDVELLPRVRGGSYNRVVAVKFSRSQQEVLSMLKVSRRKWLKQDPKTGAEFNEKLLDQVAILDFSKRRGLPVPTLLAFDPTPNNVLQSSSSLQQLVSGTPLLKVNEDLNIQ